MTEIDIKVPNIGDFKDVEVIEVLVSEGQTLKKNDPLITIESIMGGMSCNEMSLVPWQILKKASNCCVSISDLSLIHI